MKSISKNHLYFWDNRLRKSYGWRALIPKRFSPTFSKFFAMSGKAKRCLTFITTKTANRTLMMRTFVSCGLQSKNRASSCHLLFECCSPLCQSPTRRFSDKPPLLMKTVRIYSTVYKNNTNIIHVKESLFVRERKVFAEEYPFFILFVSVWNLLMIQQDATMHYHLQTREDSRSLAIASRTKQMRSLMTC